MRMRGCQQNESSRSSNNLIIIRYKNNKVGENMVQLDEKYYEHHQAWQLARDRMGHLSQLVTSLLFGNSFLVAAFAVMLGQELNSIVYYVITSVGLMLCIFLCAGINHTVRLYMRQWKRAYQMSLNLSIEPFWTIEDNKLYSRLPFVWRLVALFHLGRISGIWLPLLFIFMWAILMVYAID